jgi:hypothetical protein
MRAINVTDFEAVVEETGALMDTRKKGISPRIYSTIHKQELKEILLLG